VDDENNETKRESEDESPEVRERRETTGRKVESRATKGMECVVDDSVTSAVGESEG
jgi:hypothetical protein